jgi:hypothetical protein
MRGLLILILSMFTATAFSQVVVKQFNAGWNEHNNVEWFSDLKECELSNIDIVEKPKQQGKHGIIIVPTIIIFNNGEEVKRFQADISFKMVATKEEVQEEISKLIMNKF